MNTFIRIHRNGEDIAFATLDVAAQGLSAGVFRRDDWVVQIEGEWMQLGDLLPPVLGARLPLKGKAIPPPLPKNSSRIAPVIIAGSVVLCIVLLFATALSIVRPKDISTPMPAYSGDQEQYMRDLGDWAVQQDRSRRK